MRFSDIYGQDHIREHLQNAIKTKKLSHAYIIQGEAGSGKKTIARLLAKTVLCKEQGIEPCCSCVSCKQADSDNNPDIKYVTHEKAGIGVDDIRDQLNNDILIKPYEGPYKVYIIDEADKMNEQAQNAMLKTIEEPPEYAIIILLTVNAKLLLPTILSRCILLNTRPVGRKTVIKYLKDNRGTSDRLAEMAADFSEGVIGRAINYAASDEFITKKDEVLSFIKRINMMSVGERHERVLELSKNKEYISDYLSLLMLWYRDVLVEKTAGSAGRILFKEELSDIIGTAGRLSLQEIDKKMKAIETMRNRLNQSVNVETSLELLFTELL